MEGGAGWLVELVGPVAAEWVAGEPAVRMAATEEIQEGTMVAAQVATAARMAEAIAEGAMATQEVQEALMAAAQVAIAARTAEAMAEGAMATQGVQQATMVAAATEIAA